MRRKPLPRVGACVCGAEEEAGVTWSDGVPKGSGFGRGVEGFWKQEAGSGGFVGVGCG